MLQSGGCVDDMELVSRHKLVVTLVGVSLQDAFLKRIAVTRALVCRAPWGVLLCVPSALENLATATEHCSAL
jgi:hypothetical protein